MFYLTNCPLRDVLEILEEGYNFQSAESISKRTDKDSAGDGFGGSVDNVSGRQILIDAEATGMQQPGIKVIIAVTAIVRSTCTMYYRASVNRWHGSTVVMLKSNCSGGHPLSQAVR